MPQLTDDQRKRYTILFNKLDNNSDGRIDLNDLIIILSKNDLNNHNNNNNLNEAKLKNFINKSDKDSSGNLSFQEFAQNMQEHESRLELVFNGIDTDQDSNIGSAELINYFERELGIEINENEAKILVEKINRNGSLKIEAQDWKNFFLLTPIDSIYDLIDQWQNSTFIDIGEGITIPIIPHAHHYPNINTIKPNENQIKTELNITGLWWKNFLSGAIAGAISRTVTAPFDRLKTVMQAVGSRKPNISIKSGFQHMLSEGGLLALWRGNGINIIKIAPEAASKFMFYEEIKKHLFNNNNNEVTIGQRFISGSLAGLCAQSIIYPLEVIKTRLVLRKTGEYLNVFDLINKIYSLESPRAFYKGFVPNMLGIIPYAGTDLAVYETLKNIYLNNSTQKDQTPSIPILLACGTLSTISGQLISYPLALVRTRLQAQEVPMNSLQKETMTSLFKNIYKNEGIRGLYRGLLPNMIKVVPAVSISYVVYENMKRTLIDTSLRQSQQQ